MPLALEFVDSSTLAVYASGRVTFEEVELVIDELMTDPRLCCGVRILADCRDVKSTLSTPELRAVARDIGPLVKRGLGPIAIVASSTFLYGIARMFSAFAEVTGALVHAFRSTDEAHDWLSHQTSTVAEMS